MSAEPEPITDAKTSSPDVVEESKPTAGAAAPEPAAASVPGKTVPATATTALTKLFEELPSIIEEAQHQEMWGVTLADESHVPTTIVLEKFLRANAQDVSKAKSQLIEALKWRKQMEPSKLLESEYDSVKFGDLGYLTSYQRSDGKGKEIVTWNIYGAVKDIKATFGDVQEYVGHVSLYM